MLGSKLLSDRDKNINLALNKAMFRYLGSFDRI